jgi:hypothetical protein
MPRLSEGPLFKTNGEQFDRDTAWMVDRETSCMAMVPQCMHAVPLIAVETAGRDGGKGLLQYKAREACKRR